MSLRVRLLLVLAAVVAIALVAADAATYSSLRSFLIDQADSNLNTSHIPIEQQLSQVGPSPGQNGPGGGGGPGIHGCGDCYVAVRGSSGTDVIQQPFLPSGSQVSPAVPAHITGFSNRSDPREPTTYFDAGSAGSGPTFRVRASILESGPLSGDTLLIAMPISDLEHTLHRLLLIEMVVTAAALAAVGLGAWWLVRLGLRPLSTIERTAGAIANGDLSERVPAGNRRTEVGRLARALNVMLERIEGAFAARDRTEAELRRSEARMRRFVADASHELRTPLAAVSAYAELFDRGARSNPQDLERVMSGIRGESGRMGRLVEDLMLLARMDEGPELQISDVDLVSVAAEAVEAANAVGPGWPVTVRAEEPLSVRADQTRVRQVFDNLLSNVRSHTPSGTQVTVKLSPDGHDAMVEVSDDGPGIPAAEAARVFERFYRADPSRSRASGGSGLGLSIVQAIVTAHGGRVELEEVDGRGTTIRFWIPMAWPATD
ncbi:MAG TPA: HAMP domain-containing sensor histidine kinase [Acidimicrobiales bacterium]|nr:HAMP domain-containing sensor histidine kinase [Acidimicrobiales bacterium]